MKKLKIRTRFYQQFNADYTRAVPAQGFGGWQEADLEMDADTTAIVVMHASYSGENAQYPGWFRAVEYIPRAYEIDKKVFPSLLGAARKKKMPVFHVAFPGAYCHTSQWKDALVQADETREQYPHVAGNEIYDSLIAFKEQHVTPGAQNLQDIDCGAREALNFLPGAMPMQGEGIAENGSQLFELCRNAGINHLIYVGYAINWCLLMSPGGMVDMSRYGCICSTIEEAVTAVENKETAEEQLCKSMALWRVSVAFGYVYRLADFLDAMDKGD